MRKIPSIRKRISKYTLQGLLVLVSLFVLSIVTQGLWQRHQEVEKIEAQLLATAQTQSQRVLSTLLLPEERASLPLILEQIKQRENLSNISVSQFGQWQAFLSSGCQLVTDTDAICNGPIDTEVRIVTQLAQVDKNYGVLEKSKKLASPSIIAFSQPLFWLLLITSAIFGIMMLLVVRFIQRDLCDSVQEIVTGLEMGKDNRKRIVKKQEYREMQHLARSLYGLQSKLEQKSLKESLGEMARQVAHDLRSPLSLLKVVTAHSDHPITDAEKRLARQAVERIEEVSDTLLKKNQSELNSFNTEELGRNIEQLMEEKRYALQGKVDLIFDNQIKTDIELTSQPDTITRTLSNLLDNAIEATEGQSEPTVRMTLKCEDENLFVDILDTGTGIPEKIIEGQSSKRFGHGLGVTAARKDLSQQNGSLAYSSLQGAGTATRIRLS